MFYLSTNNYFLFFSEIFFFFICFILALYSIALLKIMKRVFVNFFEFWCSFLIFGIILTAYIQINLPTYEFATLNSSFNSTKFIMFFKILTLLILAIYVAFLKIISKNIKFFVVEFIFLISAGSLGLYLLLSSNDFLAMYLCIEIYGLSICSASALFRKNILHLESSFKYFILSCVTSSIIFFCISLIYSLTGTISFDDLKLLLYFNNCAGIYNNFSFTFIVILLIFSIFIKLGIAPFHFWMVNAYSNMPFAVFAYVVLVSKLCFFFLIFKLTLIFFYSGGLFVNYIFIFAIVFSTLYGSFGALVQTKLKKFIIFSSIANSSFFLIFFLLNSCETGSFFFCFSVFYFLTMLLLILSFSKLFNWSTGRFIEKIYSVSKINTCYPGLASVLIFSVVIISGLPPFLGFWNKILIFFFIFGENTNASYLILLILMLNVMTSFYYIRAIKIFTSNGAKNYIFLKKFSFNTSYLILILTCMLLLLSIFFSLFFNLATSGLSY